MSKKGIFDWRDTIFNRTMADLLSEFLFHRVGAQNRDMFIFEKDLVCGNPASEITVIVKVLIWVSVLKVGHLSVCQAGHNNI